MKAMEVSELAYIAGFFDGEGSFQVTRNKGTKYKDSYGILVGFSNTDKGIIEWFEDRIDGKTSIGNRYEDNRKTIFRFTVHSGDREVFLHAIYPYLKIKKDVARLVIEFQTMIRKGGGKNTGIHGIDEKEQKRREEIFWEARKLNQRGKREIGSF